MLFKNALVGLAGKDCKALSAPYDKLSCRVHAQRWLVAFALTFGIGLAGYATSAAATVLEGEVLYRERIMPPDDAVLSISVLDTSRADAPGIELASAHQRLAGASPYRWTIFIDDRLASASPNAVVRARIETNGALWMTTDTATPAFGSKSPVLVLRMVQVAPTLTESSTSASVSRTKPETPPSCAQAGTQAALNDCTYSEFLDVSAGLSARFREVEAKLSPAQLSHWRKVQKAWLGYRAEACRFESAVTDAANAKPMVQWQCNSRLTRMRIEEIKPRLGVP